MRMIDADVFDLMLKDAQAECKRNGGNFRYGVLSTVRANLAKMPTVGGWISVNDRMPENFREVITDYKINDERVMKRRKGKLFMKTGNWTGERWISIWDEYKCYDAEDTVLYWMPLPEPPKEEE